MAEAAVERLAYRIVGDPEVNARKITIGFMLEMRERAPSVGATSGWCHPLARWREALAS